jgi:ABC-type transporter MlaC component
MDEKQGTKQEMEEAARELFERLRAQRTKKAAKQALHTELAERLNRRRMRTAGGWTRGHCGHYVVPA